MSFVGSQKAYPLPDLLYIDFGTTHCPEDFFEQINIQIKITVYKKMKKKSFVGENKTTFKKIVNNILFT